MIAASRNPARIVALAVCMSAAGCATASRSTRAADCQPATGDVLPICTVDPPPDSALAAAFTPGDILEAHRTSMAVLAADVPTTAGREVVVCVAFIEPRGLIGADDETLRRLMLPGIRPVHTRDCLRGGPTIPRLDSLGRRVAPLPEAGEPISLLTRARPWARDQVLVEALLLVGNVFHRFRCDARAGGGRWTATCHANGQVVM